MILHSVTLDQVEVLKGIFAYLTDQGWFIPDWLQLLELTAEQGVPE